MREGLIRRTSLAVAALSLLLLLTTAFALASRTPSADAADSETAALIGYFNQYRTSHGASALSASINSYAQSQAQKAVDDCGYTYQLGGHNVIWSTYGYTTAQGLWNAYWDDPNDAVDPPNSVYLTNYIANSKYHSVGVGRAYGCNWGWLWVIVLDKGGGGGTTTPTTQTPSPTASKTPTPTPASSLTPTAAPTGTPTPSPTLPNSCSAVADVGDQCVTPTPTFTPAGDPTPTPPPEMPGDADCDLDVDPTDGILVLMLAAHFDPYAPCLGFHGVNCQGGVDVTDVLAILSFIGDIPLELPVGCPPLGIIVTPSPSPVPTDTPTPTATPTPSTSETPTPSLTAAGESVHHCLLALISYQLDTDVLDGELHCAPGASTEYDCYFGNVNASCAASSIAYPDYMCSFTTGYADCVPNSGEPEYQCFRNTPGAVECLPAHAGYATYECGISGGTVTCASDPPFPDFVCTKQAVDFDCAAVS